MGVKLERAHMVNPPYHASCILCSKCISVPEKRVPEVRNYDVMSPKQGYHTYEEAKAAVVKRFRMLIADGAYRKKLYSDL